MTFPGIATRKKFTYEQSYKIMSHEWNKLRKVIKYHYPDFKYIVFPRAQSNPKLKGNPIGYCHYHILCNKPYHIRPYLKRHNPDEKKYYGISFSKKWLDWKIQENKYLLGYTFIKEGKDVAEYLASDFTKDEEWIIPFKIKHHRCSQDIILDLDGKQSMPEDYTYFTKEASIEAIENAIERMYGRPLPYEEYIKQFYQKK